MKNNNQKYMYAAINNSNMSQLSRKYNNCKNTCSLPIQCLFNMPPVFYKVTGNYEKESDDKYNTILVFTEDVTIQTFITLNVHVLITLKINPSISFEYNFIQPPGIYTTPAGTEGLIIKVYFNLPNC